MQFARRTQRNALHNLTVLNNIYETYCIWVLIARNKKSVRWPSRVNYVYTHSKVDRSHVLLLTCWDLGQLHRRMMLIIRTVVYIKIYQIKRFRLWRKWSGQAWPAWIKLAICWQAHKCCTDCTNLQAEVRVYCITGFIRTTFTAYTFTHSQYMWKCIYTFTN